MLKLYRFFVNGQPPGLGRVLRWDETFIPLAWGRSPYD